jgi:plasmid stability protein
MASITIRNLDPEIKSKLRIRAAEHGRSMEMEAREILSEVLESQPFAKEGHLYDRIRQIVDSVGGFDLEIPPRHPVQDPPDFSGPEYGR